MGDETTDTQTTRDGVSHDRHETSEDGGSSSSRQSTVRSGEPGREGDDDVTHKSNDKKTSSKDGIPSVNAPVGSSSSSSLESPRSNDNKEATTTSPISAESSTTPKVSTTTSTEKSTSSSSTAWREDAPPPLTEAEIREQGKRPWTKEEDEILRQAVEKYNYRSWKLVAECLPGRTHSQAAHRWQKVLDPNLRKGTWTPEEDEMLQKAVEQVGEGQWSRVAEQVKSRNGKQCRERWRNQISPKVDKRPWTAEEDEHIMRMYAEKGAKWAEIAKEMPGRTENAVKNRWNAKLSRPPPPPNPLKSSTTSSSGVSPSPAREGAGSARRGKAAGKVNKHRRGEEARDKGRDREDLSDLDEDEDDGGEDESNNGTVREPPASSPTRRAKSAHHHHRNGVPMNGEAETSTYDSPRMLSSSTSPSSSSSSSAFLPHPNASSSPLTTPARKRPYHRSLLQNAVTVSTTTAGGSSRHEDAQAPHSSSTSSARKRMAVGRTSSSSSSSSPPPSFPVNWITSPAVVVNSSHFPSLAGLSNRAIPAVPPSSLHHQPSQPAEAEVAAVLSQMKGSSPHRN